MPLIEAESNPVYPSGKQNPFKWWRIVMPVGISSPKDKHACFPVKT
jgi:hypothetical protein